MFVTTWRELDATGISCVEAGCVAEHRTEHRESSTVNGYLVQNVNSAKIEKPRIRAKMEITGLPLRIVSLYCWN